MSLTEQIAKHFKEVFFGGNWTWSNLKDTLKDVSLEQATAKVESLNSIAVLVFHIDYYVAAVLKVLQGGSLDAHDKYSFDMQPLASAEEWEALKARAFANAELLAPLIAAVPESQLWTDFGHAKYGNHYRNFHGLIEHTHYHLGQIAVVKKIVTKSSSETK